MSTGAKAVSLHAKPVAPSSTAPQALPADLRALHEQARHFLRQGLQRVLDAADDSLFEVGGSGGMAAAQQEFFEAMRTLRLKREGVEASVLGGLDKAFRAMGADQRQALMDVLPAGLLALVSHDEMEETVAVKTMVMRSLSECASEFNPLQLRLQALVGKAVTEDNNPLSARTLCTLMLDALRPLELKIQVRLLLLKLFEKHLLKEVGGLYAAVNDSLIAAGVLPHLQLHAPRPLRTAAREREGTPRAVSAAIAAEPQAVLGQLRELLGQARGSAPAVPADALPVSQGDLTRLLSYLQRQPAPADGVTNLRQQLDALVTRASVNSPRPRVIGKLDEEVITLVSMLFEQVLGDDALPEPMRGLIGGLQVPLLKAAILDQQLFGEQAHPARQFLNEVTEAARDSAELADIHRDRLRNKIEQVGQRLRDEFTDDPAVFASLLEDFSRFTASEQRRAELLEQRLLEAEEARALRENARQQVDRLLSGRLHGLTLPAALVQGLERGWGGLLQLILLREGESSDAWLHTLATLDELLAQVKPLSSREEARLLLDPCRKELLAALRRGLEQVAYDPFEQQRFFQELTQWQRKLLTDFRDGMVPMPAVAFAESSADAVGAAGVESPAVSEAESDEVVPLESAPEISWQAAEREAGAESQPARLHPVAESEQCAAETAVVEEPAVIVAEASAAGGDAVPSEAAADVGAQVPAAIVVGEADWALVDGLGAGSWIERHAESGAKQRCKLAAFIRISGQYIFVNRAGAKVATYDRDGLAQAFASGAARLMDNAQPFDRALQAIIGNLREMRGG